MRVDRARPGWFAPATRAIATTVAIALLLAMPRHASAASGAPARSAILGEFNEICYELTLARASLARGELQDADFADRILDLFVRADSLAALLSIDQPRSRGEVAGFALERGVAYLIDSLRDNYVGIVGRNGVSFVEADQALKAAVAWRADATPSVVAR
ncbi:MAG TPA: hypothetical protein VF363_03915 [Candidatus Eisenbacteria bacterium]